ncbi:MAG TPA: ATP-dependent Clp protease adaptor ClpS [Chitinophagaceae bacterium]|nr:ATP-dependent Clp protease adaptor ClpS [Chitinophagaceae bacterium]
MQKLLGMVSYKEQPGTLIEEELLLDTSLEKSYQLIVWNDEVNTFEWVIETLVDICGHSAEQAEQCALIIHSQGKYAVKYGSYDTLKPLCDAITDRGISATVEVTVE